MREGCYIYIYIYIYIAAEGSELEMLQEILEWAKDKVTTEEINNELLLTTYNEGITVLYMVAEVGKLEILQEIME